MKVSATLDAEPDQLRSRRSKILVAVGIACIAITIGPKATAFVFAVLVSIGLHEAGHWYMARRGGMAVTEAFIGIGPRLWATQRGETTVGLKAFPIAAYVKVPGMNSLDKIPEGFEGRSYSDASFARQARMVAAGPATNLLLALVLFWVVLGFGTANPDAPVTTQIGEVAPNSAAAQAGIAKGDTIVAFDSEVVDDWETIRNTVRTSPGRAIRVTVDTDGVRRTVTLTPSVAEDGAGFAGIAAAPPPVEIRPLAAIPDAFRELGRDILTTFRGLADYFTGGGIRAFVNRNEPVNDPATATGDEDPRFLSPVGLVHVASHTASWADAVYLLAIINMSLGVINLLPLPPLDGGLLTINAYEAIRSRQVRRRYQADYKRVIPLIVGVVVIFGLMSITAMYLDITNPIPV